MWTIAPPNSGTDDRRGLTQMEQMDADKLVGVLIAWCAVSSAARAQQDEHAKVRAVVGCWTTEPGRFSVVGKTGVDSGQTTLPSRIRFDTMPGKGWRGEPLGRLVRASAEGSTTRYRDGYYLFSGADSLRVEWTNGFVGMTLQLRLDKFVMRGRALAWTDYMGYEQASIVLRRGECIAPH
jgi:hypothetical protein